MDLKVVDLHLFQAELTYLLRLNTLPKVNTYELRVEDLY
jgi:hypothetical protein